ncbi:hypothetical protein DFJ43DRAFT_376978 [Lentinula guzmanii]|uniref:G domain-containing protein n=1 Tax=Lentinula guzmanii TaxID=2804957 RepID=A0AA38JJ37_9AGAR|nr:hypothetical protein DFJ43DRAFT_376978 [Lentinula guzmanii]
MLLEMVELIVVIGASGTGKTTFINAVSDSHLPVGYSLEPCTTTIQLSSPFEICGHKLQFVDTPGDEDTGTWETTSEFLAKMYKGGSTIAGILYFPNLSGPRVGGIGRRNMRVFRELCGEAAMSKVLIVVTGIDPSSTAREVELRENPKFFYAAIQDGARLLRYDGTTECAKGIVSHLFEFEVAEGEKVVLKIQEELVNDSIKLSNSVSVAQLDPDLIQAMRNFEEGLEEIQTNKITASMEPQLLVAKLEVEDLRSQLVDTLAEKDQIANAYKVLQEQRLSLQHAVLLGLMLIVAWWVL